MQGVSKEELRRIFAEERHRFQKKLLSPYAYRATSFDDLPCCIRDGWQPLIVSDTICLFRKLIEDCDG